MASAGSFVHGDDGRIKQSKDEQDMADFLSSIDEITSSTSGSAAAARADGSNVSFRGGSSPGGDLLFGPTVSSEQGAAGSKSTLLMGPDGGHDSPIPADWLNELEGLQLGSEAGFDFNNSSSNASGKLPGGHAAWGSGNNSNSSASGSRALGEHSGVAVDGRRMSAAEKAETAAANEQLDWPGTLDMLGMAEAEKEAGPASESASTVGVPVSELPSMPPPAARQETFPDFVEIRDARHVSQFPKPDNALAARASTILGGSGGVEVYLRPDVTWEAVSDVYLAVMLSRGLVVREKTEKMVTAEKVGEGSGDWATVKLTVGVTRDKLRTLVMQFFADTRQAPILSLAGTMARFSGRAGDGLYVAIRDALVERRLPLSFLASDAEEVSLDPHYVRDLVGMYAHENVVNLTRYALPLEEFVRREEEQSARLEATLLPQYRANGLVPPRPTRSKLLSSYPLTTRRPLVSSCGVEEAREVMERAREHVGLVGGSFSNRFGDGEEEVVGGGSGGADGSGGGSEGGGRGRGDGLVAEGIRSLIRATWEDVKAWCDEEAEARVRRKDSQVRDRLLAVERHRAALIEVLRDGASGSATGAKPTPVGREFAARFRPVADEAVLCQCKAMHAKRVGQLYLTCNHLCFHSSVLGFTFQRVLPLLTVASISHAPAALGMDVVTLVDLGEESHLFGITAVEAGFPRRFHDLLQQCLVLCKADASKRAKREGAAAEAKPDEEQILAKVQRLAKAKQQREAREAASAARAAAAATAVAAAAEEEASATATAATNAATAIPPAPATADHPPADTTAKAQGPTREGAGKEPDMASPREDLSGGGEGGATATTVEAGKTKEDPAEGKRARAQGGGAGRGGGGQQGGLNDGHGDPGVFGGVSEELKRV
eukprot:jgi/Undpi1/1087/HiC_scaffold_10.g04550.m1